MKIAGIDIGTNSMRILMTDYSWVNGQVELKNRIKSVKTTRIGKNINFTKAIDPVTYNNNMESFEDFVNVANENKAEKIFAIGTSALRDAVNGQEFISQAEQNTGIKINVISGSFEAELAFYGVSVGLVERGRLLIIDIGGGSTEFVVGSKIEGILFKKSINLGAVRLTEMFGDDTESMKEHILKELDIVRDIVQRFSVKKIVGIGGTITTISAINQAMRVYDTEKIHNSIIKRIDAYYIFNSLRVLNIEDKKRVIGLQPSRADIIVAGINILLCSMNLLNIEELIVSDYDNLEGMIYYYMREE